MTQYRTHSQMAEIYHNQHLYQKSYDECMEASQIAYNNQDTLRALYARKVAIRPLRINIGFSVKRRDDVFIFR